MEKFEKFLKIFDDVKKRITNLIIYFKTKFYKVNIKKLTKLEKIIINKFYNFDLMEFSLNSVSISETEETYPVILKLIKRNILKEMSTLEKIDSYDGKGVRYNLTNRAWKKLNKIKKLGGI